MIEVGTFVGSAAIHTWAPLMQHEGNNGIVLCIDTWQGDLNMRLGEDFQYFMSLTHGHPRLYEKFLQHIVQYELQDTVFPLPIPSLLGARMLRLTNWIVDVIYVDSAHEIGETFAELMLFFQLLRPGGMMLGDDYAFFPAVKHDVDLFAQFFANELSIEFMFEKDVPIEWIITKNDLPLPIASSSSTTPVDSEEEEVIVMPRQDDKEEGGG